MADLLEVVELKQQYDSTEANAKYSADLNFLRVRTQLRPLFLGLAQSTAGIRIVIDRVLSKGCVLIPLDGGADLLESDSNSFMALF